MLLASPQFILLLGIVGVISLYVAVNDLNKTWYVLPFGVFVIGLIILGKISINAGEEYDARRNK